MRDTIDDFWKTRLNHDFGKSLCLYRDAKTGIVRKIHLLDISGTMFVDHKSVFV